MLRAQCSFLDSMGSFLLVPLLVVVVCVCVGYSIRTIFVSSFSIHGRSFLAGYCLLHRKICIFDFVVCINSWSEYITALRATPGTAFDHISEANVTAASCTLSACPCPLPTSMSAISLLQSVLLASPSRTRRFPDCCHAKPVVSARVSYLLFCVFRD